MEANAASASDGNDQTALSLITPQRHGLCRNRWQSDSSGNQNRSKKLIHLFSPWANAFFTPAQCYRRTLPVTIGRASETTKIV
jgi:hypothetical protein